MPAPTVKTVLNRLTAKFPELAVRQGADNSLRTERVILLDTIHLPDKAAWDGLQAQVRTEVGVFEGVTVGWEGAEIAVRVPKRRQAVRR